MQSPKFKNGIFWVQFGDYAWPYYFRSNPSCFEATQGAGLVATICCPTQRRKGERKMDINQWTHIALGNDIWAGIVLNPYEGLEHTQEIGVNKQVPCENFEVLENELPQRNRQVIYHYG